MTRARIAAVAEADAGWQSYGITHGRNREVWVTPEEMERIRAGISSGTVETRRVKDRAGTLDQWREVVPS